MRACVRTFMRVCVRTFVCVRARVRVLIIKAMELCITDDLEQFFSFFLYSGQALTIW